MTGKTIAANSDTQKQKAWNNSQCSTFLNLESPEAEFLARKCATKKGRWLSKCIKSYNRSGIFDEIVNRFQTFHSWKCYPAIAAYYAKKPANENQRIVKSARSPQGSHDKSYENSLNHDRVIVQPTNENETPIPVTNTASRKKEVEHLYQIIKDLQQRVTDLENQLQNLKY